jgi:hypothetical protein
MLTLEGFYRNGELILKDPPFDSPTEARVLVTFLPPSEEADISNSAYEGIVVSGTARKAAVERLIARMHSGINFGGVKFDREGLYAERIRELDER